MTNGDRLDRIEARQDDADRQLAGIRDALASAAEVVSSLANGFAVLNEMQQQNAAGIAANWEAIQENNRQIQILIEDGRADRQAWQAEMTRLREDWLRGLEQ